MMLGCKDCRYAEWSKYYPETRYDPPEYPEVVGCYLDHMAWRHNEEEGCSDFECSCVAGDPDDE